MENNKWGIIVGCLLLAASIMGASYVASQTVMQAKLLENTSITMTGSAKKQVKSDLVKWSGNFQRTALESEIKNGYAAMGEDQKKVVAFLKANGVNEGDIKITPVSMMQVYKNNDSAPKEFTLTQNVEVQSKDIEKIVALSKRIVEIVNQDVIFSSNNLEYYYTKLPDERIALLSDAVDDAKKRADEIAKNSGLHVGTIRSAAMGVVQVLPLNSTDVSDYGTYDTASPDKEVMVTVKTVFNLDR